jgi:hypothetical protein
MSTYLVDSQVNRGRIYKGKTFTNAEQRQIKLTFCDVRSIWVATRTPMASAVAKTLAGVEKTMVVCFVERDFETWVSRCWRTREEEIVRRRLLRSVDLVFGDELLLATISLAKKRACVIGVRNDIVRF